MLISILLVDEDKDKQLFSEYFHKMSQTIDDQITGSEKTNISEERSKVDTDTVEKIDRATEQNQSILRLLFDFQNVKDMFHTFNKPRPYNQRLHVILLVIVSMFLLLAYMGPNVFMYQYVQKVYNWNSATYSNYVTVTALVNIITTFLFTPVIIKVDLLYLCHLL